VHRLPELSRRRVSQKPLHPGSLRERIRALGIPIQHARTAALRQLVLQAPAPVVAQALGYHPITTHWHRTDAGGTWTSYAPGDHGRRTASPLVVA
jgi:hypothetical protein